MTATVIFTAPSDDVAWCCALAEALSVCCSCPSDARLHEVCTLLASPPLAMLPMAWSDLIAAAENWLPVGTGGARFTEARMIETALRDKPVPVPSWAEHYK